MIHITSIDVPIPPEATAGLNSDLIQLLLENVGAAARDHWIMLASQDPSSFRDDYINGIQELQMFPGMAVVALVGPVPHLLEEGCPRTDLRDILLGPQVPVMPRGERGKHQGKHGQFYRAIPFRHTGPTARSLSIGQPMGSAYAGHPAVENAKRLGKNVYAEAKKLAPSVSNPYSGKTHWGGRLNTEELNVPKLKSHHKSDIYAGMVRLQKTYAKTTQSTYHTFRTISTGVTEGWIRGPIAARHYGQDVAKFIADDVIPRALEMMLKGVP